MLWGNLSPNNMVVIGWDSRQRDLNPGAISDMRSLTWVRNVGPRCLGKKKYQNLSGSCNKTHTKKAEQEIKGERGVNVDTFVGPTSS